MNMRPLTVHWSNPDSAFHYQYLRACDRRLYVWLYLCSVTAMYDLVMPGITSSVTAQILLSIFGPILLGVAAFVITFVIFLVIEELHVFKEWISGR